MNRLELVRHVLPVLFLSALSSRLSTAAAQTLFPSPGAPAPAAKLLNPGEPRTPIDATHTPGDGGNQFIISAPGSYYLPGNVTGVSGKNCLLINADNVTVDLDGFAMVGVLGVGDGIVVSSVHRNLRLYNGSVDFWYGSGIDCSLATNSEFDHLRVSQDNGYGLACGDGSLVNGCSAEANGFQGLRAGARSTLTNCTSANNGLDGIEAGGSCTISACTSTGNLAPSAGFQLDSDCTISGCCASGNSYGIQASIGCTIRDCTTNSNSKNGINASGASLIVNCTACFNVIDGIYCANECFVSGNTTNNNRNGIETHGGLSRVDGNSANLNSQVGILWGNDFVVRNTAFGNPLANYSPAVGTGNTGPLNAASSSTSPWANF